MLYCLLQGHRLYIFQDNFFSCERTSLLEVCFTNLQENNGATVTEVLLASLAGARFIGNHLAIPIASMCPNHGDHSTATVRLLGHPYYDHTIGLGETKLLVLDSVPKKHDNKAETPALFALAVACHVCGFHYRHNH